ncbi:hypothetical protein [Tenacibaculum sp. SG-28]|uniref:hypothetical protein n=1 Tax=Tenacibaculum sp. SG-28 TaxID=754426 RepID=UPI000CF3FB17|nr:hypothetical protein [Tenacibaculum sp. SG-28]PQJ20620.1 hypothetical protein BSU00_09920 [Tenacibaculum sp. SG-28]
MKRELIFLSLLIILISCNRRKPNDIEIHIVESIKQANNERNYDLIKPFLSQKFHFRGSDINTSFTSLYAYLNFKASEEITKIEVDYVKEINDSIFSIKGTKFYENYNSEGLELTYKLTDKGAKILVISSIKPHKFPLTTRASYRNEEIFGNDRVNNIKNLNVLDKSLSDSITKFNYKIYFDKRLKRESEFSLSLFGRLDSYSVSNFQLTK